MSKHERRLEDEKDSALAAQSRRARGAAQCQPPVIPEHLVIRELQLPEPLSRETVEGTYQDSIQYGLFSAPTRNEGHRSAGIPLSSQQGFR